MSAEATNNPDLMLLGVKVSTAVAGFAGGIVSLRYVRELNTTQAMLAVFTGLACAIYGTPIAVYYFKLSSELSDGVAFLLGLSSMNIVPGFVRLSEAFKRNPMSFVQSSGGEK